MTKPLFPSALHTAPASRWFVTCLILYIHCIAGATRVELCANLHEGGTTPSVGSLLVLKQSTDIPVFVMVRPRGGDFLYSDLEFEVMKKDVASLKMHCANGIVIGILTKYVSDLFFFFYLEKIFSHA